MLGGVTFLKVKVKSLAEEAKIIHSMEGKTNNTHLRGSLYAHRKCVVAKEERDSLLAYSCLRFIPYSQVELFTHNSPDWDNVKRIVKKFGDYQKEEHYNQWLVDAKNWYDAFHCVPELADKETRESLGFTGQDPSSVV